MKIKIMAFGIAKDILNASEIEWTSKTPLSVERLLHELKVSYPAFRELRSLVIAVNESYATPEQIITANDEVVIIPPVAGG